MRPLSQLRQTDEWGCAYDGSGACVEPAPWSTIPHIVSRVVLLISVLTRSQEHARSGLAGGYDASADSAEAQLYETLHHKQREREERSERKNLELRKNGGVDGRMQRPTYWQLCCRAFLGGCATWSTLSRRGASEPPVHWPRLHRTPEFTKPTGRVLPEMHPLSSGVSLA